MREKQALNSFNHNMNLFWGIDEDEPYFGEREQRKSDEGQEFFELPWGPDFQSHSKSIQTLPQMNGQMLDFHPSEDEPKLSEIKPEGIDFDLSVK